jgi:hypothetical protein
VDRLASWLLLSVNIWVAKSLQDFDSKPHCKILIPNLSLALLASLNKEIALLSWRRIIYCDMDGVMVWVVDIDDKKIKMLR